MSEKVIIFDGKEDMAIDVDYFYQDKYIDGLTLEQAEEVAKYTSAYYKVVKKYDSEYSNQVALGSIIMDQLVADLKHINSRNREKEITI
ncbi:MAG: hypothetical protein ACFFKA_00080 [Candidatus Thorarchaeota archaeon]